MIVEIQRRADLLHIALAHRHDLVGHGHGLDLVVGDVDGGHLQPLMQILDLGAHLHPQLCVEVRQRFVEQEHLRIADDRPPHRHALALTARQLPRITAEELAEPEDAGLGATSLLDLCPSTRPASVSENAMLSYTVMCG